MKPFAKRKLTIAATIIAVGGAMIFLVLPSLIGVAYPVSKSDYISSWSWTGVYSDGGEQEAEVRKEIEHLQTEKTYASYITLASQYELIGDGKSAYLSLSKAIAMDQKQGPAYFAMARLMEKLGAFATARQAYTDAIAAEPDNELYRSARDAFIAQHP